MTNWRSTELPVQAVRQVCSWGDVRGANRGPEWAGETASHRRSPPVLVRSPGPSPGISRVLGRVLGGVLGVMVVGVPTAARSQPSPGVGQFLPGTCPPELPAEALAQETFRCGQVVVPERHSNPEQGSIKLGVVVVESNSPNPQLDPLVMVQGGPGGSIFDVAQLYLDTLSQQPGLRDRDVIFFDQRGTLHAEPFLFCNEVYEFTINNLDEPLTDELKSQSRAAVRACRDRLLAQNIDLAAYNSLENAADVPLLVSALGYEGQYNFFGVSYGTMLAQHLMRDHGDRLRSVILDSVAPLDISFIQALPKNASQTFQNLFAACAADPACAERYPNLEREFLDAVTDLNANPVNVSLTNVFALSDAIAAGNLSSTFDSTQFEVPVRFDGDLLVIALGASFYSSASIPKLPQAIREVREGNFRGVLDVVPLLAFNNRSADGLYNSVVCSEDYDFALEDVDLSGIPDEIRDSLRLTPEGVLDACAAWDVPELGPDYDRPVQSEIPALLLSGEFDQITPPHFAERVAQTLAQAQQFVLPGMGHAVLGSDPCVSDLAGQFLANPTAPVDTHCVDQLKTTFALPEAIALQTITLDALGVRTQIPAQWQPLPDTAATWGELDPNTNVPTGRALSIWQLPDADLRQVLVQMPVKLRSPETRQVGDRTWEIYHADNPAVVSSIAVTTRNDTAYVILLDTDSLWHRDAVLQAALDQFQILP